MDDEMLYREMNEEDPYYMGSKKYCDDCRFCREQSDGSMRCSISGRRVTEESTACSNYI